MESFPLKRTCELIEPGPIVLVTTRTPETGEANVMTMGFHMMVEHYPPKISFVLGPWDYSYETLRKTKECVISIPPANLAETVVDIGNCSGEDCNKFAQFQLTSKEASKISPPLINECMANLECKVVETLPRHNMFIAKVVAAWQHKKLLQEQPMIHHKGDGVFSVDDVGKSINLSHRMTKWVGLLD
ncbi:hypothetical protein TRICI_003201 [Trichomonascus ciferrii]|uniref:Flavin reductase like domain-containing protein n=1 Tax=Trichomonascus ciferrii TaxID=44093 RepID=A0A642V3T0_9ASCO|nr:hypothetical protein TRICI_003201 [Trichomonascus ciferrii]